MAAGFVGMKPVDILCNHSYLKIHFLPGWAIVVGKSIVESYGGQVRLVDILEGHSTTAIARKLSANGNRKEEGVNNGHQPGTA